MRGGRNSEDRTPKDGTPKDGTPKDGTPKVEIDQKSESAIRTPKVKTIRTLKNSPCGPCFIALTRSLIPSPVCIFDLSQFQTLKRVATVVVSKMYLMKSRSVKSSKIKYTGSY